MRADRLIFWVILTGLGRAWALEPLVYTVRIPAPAGHSAEISVRVPTEGRASLELMMPVWSPGYYVVQDYAAQVQAVAAVDAAGKPLGVDHSAGNRWRVQTGGSPALTFSYRLACPTHFVTTNLVDPELAVLNGPATFIGPVAALDRPCEVWLELPAGWRHSATGLDEAADHAPGHYQAADYDTLLDSPIVAGTFSIHVFEVAGTRNELVDIGAFGGWDGAKATTRLTALVQENLAFWGQLPYRKYVFLNVFGPGAGGLEHLNSTMLSSQAPPEGASDADFRWYSYVSHEFFHGYNVKRLRPVELGPFDYERPPRTAGLWVAEGLTTYYGPVLAVRAGLGGVQDFLAELSGVIRSLQTGPGRLKQTLERSSLDVWEQGGSGVGGDPAKGVSYYVKGPVVGLLLDARIRTASQDRRSLDDLMRLAYQRYGGSRGFTEAQFRAAAEEVAGTSLQAWFRKHLASTEELDYREALACFGLRFKGGDWTLEVDPAATPAQKARLADLLGSRRKGNAPA